MDSKTIYMDYLAHYGVKGMKWGVRRKPDYFNKNGTLSKSGYNKYYTKGRLNAAGIKARNKAIGNKNAGKHPAKAIGMAAATGVLSYAIFGKSAVRTMHGLGNITINAMKASGKSLRSRQIVSGLFIAGMGTILASEISPTVSNAYAATRYNVDKKYKRRVDLTANLDFTEAKQRSKKGKK